MRLLLPSPLAGEGLGERGSELGQRVENARQYALGIVQDIVVPEPQDAEALLSQSSITLGIALAGVMLAAIGLDDQLGAKMDEIDDIGAEGLLAAKLLARQAMTAEMAP